MFGGSRSNQDQNNTATKRANSRVKAFLRKMNFENYVKYGMNVTDAARRVGVKIPPGRVLSADEVSKILEKQKI